MKNLSRPIIVKTYLNKDEKKLLDAKVKEAGFHSTTAYMRQLIKYGFIYNVDYSDMKDMVRQIHGVSVNINQIAHKVNATDSVYWEDIENLKKELDEIWHIVRSTLSETVLEER